MVRQFGTLNLYLDFLTEDPLSVTGSRVVDDVVACVISGVNRALTCRRMVKVKGRDLYGAEQEWEVAVADIGPLLACQCRSSLLTLSCWPRDPKGGRGISLRQQAIATCGTADRGKGEILKRWKGVRGKSRNWESRKRKGGGRGSSESWVLSPESGQGPQWQAFRVQRRRVAPRWLGPWRWLAQPMALA